LKAQASDKLGIGKVRVSIGTKERRLRKIWGIERRDTEKRIMKDGEQRELERGRK